MTSYDALVLGGGPAGATAGLVLARAGWRVAIVEKSAFPRRKVCGEFISATTLPLLAELGIGEEFLSLAGPEVLRVGLFEGTTSLSAPMPRTSGFAGWGRALGREHLDLILLRAAAQAGAQVWQPWKAVSLERDSERWTCALAGEDASAELSAPVIIAANGSWQRGPLPAPGNGEHRNSDLLAFKAHFEATDLAGDLMPLLVFPGGYGGMVHTDAGRVSLSCCIRRDRLNACRAQSGGRAAEAVADHILASCAGAREALRRAHLAGAWLSAGPIRPGIRHCHAPGVFFTGNIAGEAHPIIAEGISMAMQSSWLLGRRLIAAGEDCSDKNKQPGIGRAYAAEWRKAFATRIHAAAAFAHLAMRPSTAAMVRPLLERFPGILTLGARFAGKAKLLAQLPEHPRPGAAAPEPSADEEDALVGDPGRT